MRSGNHVDPWQWLSVTTTGPRRVKTVHSSGSKNWGPTKNTFVADTMTEMVKKFSCRTRHSTTIGYSQWRHGLPSQTHRLSSQNKSIHHLHPNPVLTSKMVTNWHIEPVNLRDSGVKGERHFTPRIVDNHKSLTSTLDWFYRIRFRDCVFSLNLIIVIIND